MELEFTDRIEIGVGGASAELQKAIEQFRGVHLRRDAGREARL